MILDEKGLIKQMKQLIDGTNSPAPVQPPVPVGGMNGAERLPRIAQFLQGLKDKRVQKGEAGLPTKITKAGI